MVAEFAVAVAATVFAGALLWHTRRRLAAQQPGSSAARDSFWVILYTTLDGSLDSALGYVWNMFITALVFQPILSASSEDTAGLAYSMMYVLKGLLVTAVASFLYLRYLEPIKSNFDELSFRGSLNLAGCSAVVQAIAAGCAEAIYYFCTDYLAAQTGTAVGLVAAWGCALLVVLLTIAAAARLTWEPSSAGAAFLLDELKMTTSYMVWYPLAGTLAELPDYSGSDSTGLALTFLMALVSTMVFAAGAGCNNSGNPTDDETAAGAAGGGETDDDHLQVDYIQLADVVTVPAGKCAVVGN